MGRFIESRLSHTQTLDLSPPIKSTSYLIHKVILCWINRRTYDIHWYTNGQMESYFFKTISLYMMFIMPACHWQNRQLASSSPRNTTWPLDRASANGLRWSMVHEGGRLHVLELSVLRIRNESKAAKSEAPTAPIDETREGKTYYRNQMQK